MKIQRIHCASGAHPAIRRAASMMAEAFQAEVQTGGAERCDVLLQTAGAAEEPVWFQIEERGGRFVFESNTPRGVLAAVLYYLHHLRRGGPPPLPLRRSARPGARLVMEDFPFHCYAPTGLEIDPWEYAENLVALGFSGMECNRASSGTRPGASFDAYQLTNPSPAWFVWTPWHEGVWEREWIEANARELERCISAALECGLEPTLTSFVPRPYPEAFFEKHPHLRGPAFRHHYLEAGGHPAVHSLDTDHPEAFEFYQTVYRGLFRRHPEIRHLFFWHGDLGTQFWKDGEGPCRRTLAERIGTFHDMIGRLLSENGMQTQVWVNPWALPHEALEAIDARLPRAVGYTVKDNPGAEIDAGTSRVTLGDATVVSAALGAVPLRVQTLARRSGRRVCLGQYVDFSEDLDPVLGLPHPIMTFRKWKSLERFAPSDSSANWGILPPELSPASPNQDVLREMAWGSDAQTFAELLPRLLPAGTGEEGRRALFEAWARVDEALRLWPQFWGLRLQDSGVRLRWLLKPILLPGDALSPEERDGYLDFQIYRIDAPNLLDAFMDLTPAAAAELELAYQGMVERLQQAEAAFAKIPETDPAKAWAAPQSASTRLLRHFWTTYAHLLQAASAELDAPLAGTIRREIENVEETIGHLQAHPKALLTVEAEWGQCFGRNVLERLRQKAGWMRRSLERGGL